MLKFLSLVGISSALRTHLGCYLYCTVLMLSCDVADLDIYTPCFAPGPKATHNLILLSSILFTQQQPFKVG